MLTTTLSEILDNQPCGQDSNGESGFSLGLVNAKKAGIGPDDPITIMQILESNGIEDAVWALCCFDYKDYCLFLADVAESVLSFYEKDNSNKAPRLAINGIRDFHAGKITKKELKKLTGAAYVDAATAGLVAYVDAAAYAAAVAAGLVAYVDVAAHTAAVASYANARKEKWAEIEQLFIKHFGDR